jgi:hypothetical protein
MGESAFSARALSFALFAFQLRHLGQSFFQRVNYCRVRVQALQPSLNDSFAVDHHISGEKSKHRKYEGERAPNLDTEPIHDRQARSSRV